MKERTLTAQARQPPQFLVRLFFAELMISKTRLRSTQRAQVRARLKKASRTDCLYDITLSELPSFSNNLIKFIL